MSTSLKKAENEARIRTALQNIVFELTEKHGGKFDSGKFEPSDEFASIIYPYFYINQGAIANSDDSEKPKILCLSEYSNGGGKRIYIGFYGPPQYLETVKKHIEPLKKDYEIRGNTFG